MHQHRTIPAGLLDDLRILRELRYAADSTAERRLHAELESAIAAEYGAPGLLAVYGSLAPGGSNHHVLAGIDGAWQPGCVVRGHLMAQGWGSALGYPAWQWIEDGPEVGVQVFRSPTLPAHWPRLDEFEGANYQRILAPVYQDCRFVTVANIYEFTAGQ